MVGFEMFPALRRASEYGQDFFINTVSTRFKSMSAGSTIPFVFYDHLPMVRLARRFTFRYRHRIFRPPSRALSVSHPRLAGTIFPRCECRHRLGNGWPITLGYCSSAYLTDTGRSPSQQPGHRPVAGRKGARSTIRAARATSAAASSNALSSRSTTPIKWIYLRPISRPPVDSGRFDRSGLWVNSGTPGYVVTDVAAKARQQQQAGIQGGTS